MICMPLVFMVIPINDAIKYAWMYLMKSCGDLSLMFKKFLKTVTTQFDGKIKQTIEVRQQRRISF